MLLNLGGMANLTYVPRRAVEEGAFAFDTGPGMALVDAVARLVDPSLRYDLDGGLARRGRVNQAAARRGCSPIRSSRAPPPKSTGRERFGLALRRARSTGRSPGPTAWPPRSS